jgi:hypothetical protein
MSPKSEYECMVDFMSLSGTVYYQWGKYQFNHEEFDKFSLQEQQHFICLKLNIIWT